MKRSRRDEEIYTTETLRMMVHALLKEMSRIETIVRYTAPAPRRDADIDATTRRIALYCLSIGTADLHNMQYFY